MEEEADVDVVGAGEGVGGAVGRELEGHGGGVVGHAEEVDVDLRQVGLAEEGLEATVGAKLHVEWRGAVAGDGAVERLHDLRGDDGAGYRADGRAGVVGQVEFVLVGQGAYLEEGFVGEDLRVVDAGVVDFGDVDEIENCAMSVT